MREYEEHLNRITEELQKSLGAQDLSNITSAKTNKDQIIENTLIDTEQYLKELFKGESSIKYSIEVTGNDKSSMLVDVKPKNLYTACRFLGFKVSEDAPEEGKAEFDRLTILYDHKEGMNIIPNDPLDDLSDLSTI